MSATAHGEVRKVLQSFAASGYEVRIWIRGAREPVYGYIDDVYRGIVDLTDGTVIRTDDVTGVGPTPW